MKAPRVVVVTGSDLGRSPRMVRHALAFAAAGCAVTLIGADGHALPAAVRDHAAITVRRLPLEASIPTTPTTTTTSRLRWATRTIGRLGRFARALQHALIADGPPAVVVVQTPPGTPIVDVCARVARSHGARVILDWHNLEAGMIALRLGPRHPLVRAIDQLEHRRAQDTALHLAVTSAMTDTLRARGRHHVVTFKDAPERWLDPPTPAQRAHIRATHALPDVRSGPLAVMSSSYSLDDDLDLLVAGLRAMPGPLSLLLTGDGPRRDEAIARLRAIEHLHVVARFVDADDYLDVLAAADVGLCVHRSATGRDFPMKLTDYAAARLPSLALDDGPALRAGLRPGDRTAKDAATFAAGLTALLHDRPPPPATGPTWQEAWTTTVWPEVQSLLGTAHT